MTGESRLRCFSSFFLLAVGHVLGDGGFQQPPGELCAADYQRQSPVFHFLLHLSSPPFVGLCSGWYLNTKAGPPTAAAGISAWQAPFSAAGRSGHSTDGPGRTWAWAENPLQCSPFPGSPGFSGIRPPSEIGGCGSPFQPTGRIVGQHIEDNHVPGVIGKPLQIHVLMAVVVLRPGFERAFPPSAGPRSYAQAWRAPPSPASRGPSRSGYRPWSW